MGTIDFVGMGTPAKARGVFLLAIALLCTSAGAVYLSFSYFKESAHWVSRTQEVRAALGDLESTINRAGRARTEFLVSGDTSHLPRYQQAVEEIPPEFVKLHTLIADNPVERQNFVELESVTQTRLQSWQNEIAQKSGGTSIDLTYLLQQNLELASHSAAISESIRNEENSLLVSRTLDARRRFVVAKVTVAVSFALAIFFLFYYYQLLRKELQAREQAEAMARSGYEREADLRREQEKFRLVVDAVKDYAIYMLDPAGHVSSWNQGAERIKGYTADEIIGQHFSCFFTEEERRLGKPEEEIRVAAKAGQFEGEGWRVRKDGSQFWGNIVLTCIRDEQGKLIGFAKITRDFTERMQAQERLRKANTDLELEVSERLAAERKLAISETSLRELSHHLLRTQDEERKRIGRELHDSLGQYLAVLKMNLDTLQFTLEPNHDGAGEHINRCLKLAEDSIREMRTISYLLYPPMLEEVGLKSAITWYLEGFSQRSEIQTTFEADPQFGRLSRDSELALFRVLQESLTNVHRHSQSPTAAVRLFKNEGHAVLEVRDQGQGIPVDLLRESDRNWIGSLGVGIRGMNERMRQLGGTLVISSTENGTVVVATVPVEQTVCSDT